MRPMEKKTKWHRFYLIIGPKSISTSNDRLALNISPVVNNE